MHSSTQRGRAVEVEQGCVLERQTSQQVHLRSMQLVFEHMQAVIEESLHELIRPFYQIPTEESSHLATTTGRRGTGDRICLKRN